MPDERLGLLDHLAAPQPRRTWGDALRTDTPRKDARHRACGVAPLTPRLDPRPG